MKRKNIVTLSAIFAIVALCVMMFSFKKEGVEDSVVTREKTSPLTFNPYVAADLVSHNTLVNEVATLLKFDHNLNVKNNAAESIRYNEDSKTFSVKLIDGLKYENGKVVTAQDYKNGIEYLINPSTKSLNTTFITTNVVGANEFVSGKTKHVSGINVLNKKEFTIKLYKNFPDFKKYLTSIAMSPLNMDFYNKHKNKFGTSAKNFLSSGPMKIKENKVGQYVKLTSNDQSVLSKNNKVKNIVLKIIENDFVSSKMFNSGKLNDIEKTKQNDVVVSSNKKSKLVIDNSPSLYYLVANVSSTNKHLNNALYYALDKNYINKTFFDNNNVVRSVITPKYHSYDDVEAKLKSNNVKTSKNEFDLNFAKSELKKSNKKSVNIITAKEFNVNKDFSAFIKYCKYQFEKLGVKVNLMEIPFMDVNAKINQKYNASRNDYDYVFSGWNSQNGLVSESLNILDGNSEFNVANINNFEYNFVINNIKHTQDASKTALIVKSNKDNNFVMPLWQNRVRYYINDNGYQLKNNGYMFNNSEFVKY